MADGTPLLDRMSRLGKLEPEIRSRLDRSIPQELQESEFSVTKAERDLAACELFSAHREQRGPIIQAIREKKTVKVGSFVIPKPSTSTE